MREGLSSPHPPSASLGAVPSPPSRSYSLQFRWYLGPLNTAVLLQLRRSCAEQAVCRPVCVDLHVGLHAPSSRLLPPLHRPTAGPNACFVQRTVSRRCSCPLPTLPSMCILSPSLSPLSELLKSLLSRVNSHPYPEARLPKSRGLSSSEISKARGRDRSRTWAAHTRSPRAAPPHPGSTDTPGPPSSLAGSTPRAPGGLQCNAAGPPRRLRPGPRPRRGGRDWRRREAAGAALWLCRRRRARHSEGSGSAPRAPLEEGRERGEKET